MSLDQLTLTTKCRIRAKSCLPLKPDSYCLCFYDLLEVDPNSVPYLFSSMNNELCDISSTL